MNGPEYAAPLSHKLPPRTSDHFRADSSSGIRPDFARIGNTRVPPQESPPMCYPATTDTNAGTAKCYKRYREEMKMLDSQFSRVAVVATQTRRQHKLILDKLGRVPNQSLQAMYDYGLNDREIGRYFNVSPSSVGRLRRTFGCAA